MATKAPPKERHTYVSIPPPPLPKFYLPTQVETRKSSSTSSLSSRSEAVVRTKRQTEQSQRKKIFVVTEESPTPAVKALADLAESPGDATDERVTKEIKYTRYRETPAPVITVPPPPPVQTSHVPPLAVYHICRICLRPRSARYHREHPIPVNGVPPPPGICRGCRITSIEEVPKSAEMVVGEESNKMRIGIGCIVPDQDYVSNAEMHRRRGKQLMPTCAQILQTPPRQRLVIEEQESSGTGSSERELMYRHVRVRESTSEPPARPKTSAESTAQDAIDALGAQSEHCSFTEIEGLDKKATLKSKPPKSAQAPATQQDEVDHNDVPKLDWFVEVGQGKVAVRGLSQLPGKGPIDAAMSPYVTPAEPQRSALFPPHVLVRESAPSKPSQQPTYTESYIRRLAREEVERYRQAERKLDAHTDPYAHGRMVPVEGKIKNQADVASTLPWDVKVERVIYEAPRNHAQPPPPLPASIINAEMRREKESWHLKTQKPSPGRDLRTDGPSISRWLDEQPSAWDTKHRGEAKRDFKKDVALNSDLLVPANQASTEYHQPESMETGQRSVQSERRKWDLMTESNREPMTIRGGRTGDSDVVEGITTLKAQVPEGYAQTRPRSGPHKAAEVREREDSRLEGRSQPSTGREGRYLQYERGMPERILDVRDFEKAWDSQEASAAGKDDKRVSSTKDDTIYQDEERRSKTVRGTSSLASRSSRVQAGEGQQPVRRRPIPRDSSSSDPPRTRAFDIRWEAATRKQQQLNETAREMHFDSEKARAERQECHSSNPESSRTRGPGSEATGSRRRPGQSPETEYIYIERIVERIDPYKNTRRHGGSNRSDLQSEELLRTSKGSKADRRVDSEAPSKAAYRVESMSPSYSKAPPSHASRRSCRPEPPPQGAEEGGGSEHSKSSRVHFASKIEISPTPPRSDASSNQFRVIGAQPSTKKRMEGGESAEDLIAEFEEMHRGRTRLGYRSMRGGGGSTTEREVIHGEEKTGRCSSYASSRQSSATGHSQYQTSNGQPLSYPLSESPSRERSDSPSPERRSGHGPYAPELPRPESMHTEWASGHGSSARADKHLEHARDPWREDLTATESRKDHAGW